ncbi:hypothetical protein D9V62_02945 [Buchnera aphidicola (Aphis helianthi)]|uniref:Cell division protein FtsN n=1 Tax=Buchnera aphidicola (Aphis helianthi) TaxID=2315802 RepID=A0A4D6XUU6_9GAMM|nr:hypothetical protein [Buchnera aphidicola]QCI17371.1 hypothetical protein D9V62_02945 [Buchnera aphidicola (Aphis helianthi)]
MYKNQNKINSMYFKKKKKKKIKFNKYNLFIILIVIIIFLIFFKIFSKNTNQKVLIQKKENENILPAEPKERWKYIKKLENL